MDESPQTRAYLESLTSSDLIKIADNLGVDIPPDLDRIFIIEEILEAGSPGDEEPEPPLETGPVDLVAVESVPLPKQYSITFIEVLVRDPFWAFVFWEIKAQDKEQLEKSQEFEGYYLKVSPCSAEERQVFMIPVKGDDSAWYLGLTPAMSIDVSPVEQSQYKVELCARLKGEEMILASSNPIKLPCLPRDAGKKDVNPLVSLSGYGDFHILRNKERALS